MNEPLDYFAAKELPGFSPKALSFISGPWLNSTENPTRSGLREFIAKGEREFIAFARRHGAYGMYGPKTYAELAAWAAGDPMDIGAKERKTSALGAITKLLNLGVITEEEAKELRNRNV